MGRLTPVAIAADSPQTVAAAEEIARSGGNAVDIAVAAAMAASLVEILMCSLGGSAFLMVKRSGRPAELIDGADSVPRAANSRTRETMDLWDVHLPYGDGIRVSAGPASVAVPGMLAALEMAWQRHGRLPWAEVLAPALRLAREGFPLSRVTAAWLEIAGPSLFHRQPESRACFCPDLSRLPRAGEWFQLPHMADSLELIAREGARAFYQGEIAAIFAATMRDSGGLVSREDLAAYRPELRRPLILRSRGFELALNPPPAVGGAALGSLIGVMALEGIAVDGPDQWLGTTALIGRGGMGRSEALRALRHARAQMALFSLRRRALGQTPLARRSVEALMEPEHLMRQLRQGGCGSTTHLSVADASGELVAVTLSNGYGSGISIPGTGIACNNSLGEPELNPAGLMAAPAGSRLVSNMAPSIACHGDGHAFAFGSPGASRITSAMAQVWERHTEEGMTLESAIAAPRLHVNAEVDPPRLLVEPGIDPSLLEPEFVIQRFEAPNMYFGGIKLAGIDRHGSLQAYADQRREGCVAFVE